MSAPRAAAQLLRMPESLGFSFRPLLRGRGRRSGVRLKTTGQYCFLPLLHPMEERDGERRSLLSRIPLSSVLSPFVPHGERKKSSSFETVSARHPYHRAKHIPAPSP